MKSGAETVATRSSESTNIVVHVGLKSKQPGSGIFLAMNKLSAME